jgi:hypothetical protein
MSWTRTSGRPDCDSRARGNAAYTALHLRFETIPGASPFLELCTCAILQIDFEPTAWGGLHESHRRCILRSSWQLRICGSRLCALWRTRPCSRSKRIRLVPSSRPNRITSPSWPLWSEWTTLAWPPRAFRTEVASGLIPKVLALAGKRLVVGSDTLRVGVPHVQGLRPAPVLAARLVTTRNGQDERRFDEEIARQLTGLGITVSATRGRRRILPHQGQDRRGLRRPYCGIECRAESLRVQENDLGGRRKMGCGVFVPAPGSPAGALFWHCAPPPPSAPLSLCIVAQTPEIANGAIAWPPTSPR